MDGSFAEFLKGDSAILAYALILVVAGVFTAIFRQMDAQHKAAILREQQNAENNVKMADRAFDVVERNTGAITSLTDLVRRQDEHHEETNSRLEKIDRRLARHEAEKATVKAQATSE